MLFTENIYIFYINLRKYNYIEKTYYEQVQNREAMIEYPKGVIAEPAP